MPDPEEISKNILAGSAGDFVAGDWFIDLL
jgi:hypothetical protein